jgi:predicted TPR repeat methyltransferase
MDDESPSTADSWLRVPPTDSGEISDRYDDWATSYEADLVDAWNYDAPVVAARLLAAERQPDPVLAVLDIGCGTGLVGRALRSTGFAVIDGTDLSAASLELAASSSSYRTLTRVDFNQSPFPASDNAYGAAVCVGVMSCAIDPVGLIREVCRVVAPGGPFVFTHRTDLWDEQDLGSSLRAMEKAGELSGVSWTEPQQYMPGSPDYADLRIRYVTATI